MSAKPMQLGEKMRAKLIQSEQTLSEVLQAARACTFETGPDLRVTDVSGQSGWISGDAAQLIGKKIDELVADRDDLGARNTFADIGVHKPFRDLTLQVPSSQGLRFVRASGKPRLSAGQFVGYRGVAIDVTPAIDSEHRAAASHRALVEAIESIPASLMLFDADDRLAICNSITKRYFPGANHLLVPGTRFEDLLRADIAGGFLWRSGLDIEKWIARRMKRHRSAKTSLTGQRSDGRWIQVIERRTSDGGTIGIRTDVTKLKRAEMQLTQAKELAEAASHAKSAFLAHMSHELRTPLNAVIGFSDMIASGMLGPGSDATHRQYAGYINSSGQHLLELVNEILDISKLLADQLVLREEPIDLQPLLSECFKLVTVQATQKAITLALTAPTDLTLLTADELRLKQVLLNLLSNAVKFSAKGSVVDISLGRSAKGDLVIAVRDQGIGMRTEDIPIALEPFRQLENGLPAQEGTGLGLPLAKRIVEKHGGTLSIASAPGAGTTVSVRLPAWRLARNEADEPPVDAIRQSTHADLRPAGGAPLRALLGDYVEQRENSST